MPGGFQDHDREWDRFERCLEALEREPELTYDPFQRADREWSLPQPAIVTHLYTLPRDALPLDIRSLFPSPPNWPKLRRWWTTPPELLMLGKSEYPENFYKTSLSYETENGLGTTSYKIGHALGVVSKKMFGSKLSSKAESSELSLSESPKLILTPFERTSQYRQSLLARQRALKLKDALALRRATNLWRVTKRLCKDRLEGEDAEEVRVALELIDRKSELPAFLRRDVQMRVIPESKVCFVEFEFPDFSDTNLVVSYSTRSGYIDEDRPKFASESAKKRLVKSCLSSLILRFAKICSLAEPSGLFSHIAVNARQKWFDPATGQEREGIIASLFAHVEDISTLDLSKLDPDVAFKSLKGIATPNLGAVSPIRPTFTIDKNDGRIVESRDVASSLEAETNLASMDWEDFEHLVAQLLEWEFRSVGIEVRVTQASRDRGVDALLFDPDPLRGGKFVIQAKRYTRVVDVSAVRDLYGTVMNEGANRGILLTTASFGPDSYEFARDKPLSLVDGQNLLLMLQKHGKKYRINLEEARLLAKEEARGEKHGG